MKNILVPTDFSESSLDALKVAGELARKSASRIHIVHVYERPLSGIALDLPLEGLDLSEIKHLLSREMERLTEQQYLEGVQCIQHFIPDKQLWQVLQSSELKNADLIVMGSHGASGMRELFLGSTTQKIVQLSEVPVLVTKSYVSVNKIRDVVFASNFRFEATTGFDEIKALTDLLDANIHLLKVITPREFEDTEHSTALMERFADSMNLQNYTVNTYNDQSVENGIYEFSESINADLIAIETHGTTGLAHFVLGSIAEQVVSNAEIPVLTSRIENLGPAGPPVYPNM